MLFTSVNAEIFHEDRWSTLKAPLPPQLADGEETKILGLKFIQGTPNLVVSTHRQLV